MINCNIINLPVFHRKRLIKETGEQMHTPSIDTWGLLLHAAANEDNALMTWTGFTGKDLLMIHQPAAFSKWVEQDFQFWGTWLLLFDWGETYWQHAGFIILQRRRRWGKIVSKLTFSISWWMKSVPSFHVTFHLPFVLLQNLFSFSLIHLFCPFLDLIALNI